MVVLGCSLVIIPAMGKLTSLFYCVLIWSLFKRWFDFLVIPWFIWTMNSLAQKVRRTCFSTEKWINLKLISSSRSYGWRASSYRRVSNLLPFRLYSINLKTEDSIALLKLYTSFMAQSVSKMKPPGWQRTGFSRSKRSNVSTYEVKNVQWLFILRPKCHEICVLWLHIHKFTFPL